LGRLTTAFASSPPATPTLASYLILFVLFSFYVRFGGRSWPSFFRQEVLCLVGYLPGSGTCVHSGIFFNIACRQTR